MRMVVWSVISLVFGFLYAIPGIIVDQPMGILVATFVVLAVYYAVYPFYYARKSEKMLKKHFGGEIPITRVCIGDEIEVFDGERTYILEYEDLDKVTALKRGYYLRHHRVQAVLIDPNGFVKGDFASFKVFLRAKCPHLNIPD
jgi:hypothetical protein